MPDSAPEIILEKIDFLWEGSGPENSSLAILPDLSGWNPRKRSYVAYSIESTREALKAGELKIQARFWKSTPSGMVQVRTRDTGEVQAQFAADDALGQVTPTLVSFNETGYSVYGGQNAEVPLTLAQVAFPELGVGVYDINWQWEFRLPDETKSTDDEIVWEEEWHAVTVSNHRLFVVLGVPEFPWTPFRLPDFSQPPPYPLPLMAEALTIACSWAQGSNSLEAAARRITDSLYDSGLFSYNCNSSYFQELSSHTISLWEGAADDAAMLQARNFYFSKVVERLHGGFGLGKYINCLDCALIVTALANLLGCRLQVGKLMHTDQVNAGTADFYKNNRFEVKAIKAIGHTSSEQTLKGIMNEGKPYFSFHAIAWQAVSEEKSAAAYFSDPQVLIYDACVRFEVKTEGDETPQYLSAAGIPLGDGTDASHYRNRLAAEGEEGLQRCLAQPASVMKMQVR